ncbi:MAG: tetratricopeptide repeat protein [Deltaproteobacteria bacterium]|nr:tetratricopeptide repeat protein [Deltaproteobacteria bacterium]
MIQYNIMKLRGFSMLVVIALALTSCMPKYISSKDREESSLRCKAGEFYFAKGEYAKALSEFVRAVEVNPENDGCRQILGLTYLAKKLYPEAIREFSVIIKKNPESATTHVNIGAVYMELKEWDTAIYHYDIAAKNVFYTSPELAYSNMGWAYYNKGAYDKALINLGKAIEIRKDYALPYYNTAMVYEKLGKDDEAVKSYEKAVKFDERFVDAHYRMGQVYLRLKKKAEAAAAFKKVVELEPDGDRARAAKDYLGMIK